MLKNGEFLEFTMSHDLKNQVKQDNNITRFVLTHDIVRINFSMCETQGDVV